MTNKSLKVNAMLNTVRNILSIIFPLITFPYVSRILQVENLGKINFTGSIISYFSLLAALGISTYAIREGSGFRDNNDKFSSFANQIFTINIISTIISYIVLFSLILFVPKLQSYRLLLIIQSIPIIFNTVGLNWLNSIYEDYLYITIRSLAVQFISLILLFYVVKTKEDYYLYALITAISVAGGNIFNFFYTKKYCKIRLVKNINIKEHVKPIIVIFAIDIAASIYLNSDMTMIGWMVGSYNVGLYSVSVKVYTIIKTLLSSIIIVTLPRLCFYLVNDQKEKYNKTLNKIFNYLLLLLLPLVVGINLLCEEIILILSGSNYLEAIFSLRILSIALIFSIFASFINYSVLIPLKKEKYILRATIVASITNISLNLFFIPALQQNGAAITTMISEFLVLMMSYYFARKDFKINGIANNLITSIIGCVALTVVVFILKHLINNMILYMSVTIIGGIFTYGTTLMILRNELTWEFISGFFNKMKNKFYK